MNVSNANIEPTIEHGGTCKTYFMVPKEAMRAQTMGSYLEYVAEFEISAGSHLEPHRHNTHEYYYILKGRALMQIGEDSRRKLERADPVQFCPPQPALEIMHRGYLREGVGRHLRPLRPRPWLPQWSTQKW